jgi:hypothetical protein
MRDTARSGRGVPSTVRQCFVKSVRLVLFSRRRIGTMMSSNGIVNMYRLVERNDRPSLTGSMRIPEVHINVGAIHLTVTFRSNGIKWTCFFRICNFVPSLVRAKGNTTRKCLKKWCIKFRNRIVPLCRIYTRILNTRRRLQMIVHYDLTRPSIMDVLYQIKRIMSTHPPPPPATFTGTTNDDTSKNCPILVFTYLSILFYRHGRFVSILSPLIFFSIWLPSIDLSVYIPYYQPVHH